MSNNYQEMRKLLKKNQDAKKSDYRKMLESRGYEFDNNGDIVVALVDDCEATLKQIKKDGSDILLIPKNEAYEIRRLPAKRVKIQGILSSLIRTYH